MRIATTFGPYDKNNCNHMWSTPIEISFKIKTRDLKKDKATLITETKNLIFGK